MADLSLSTLTDPAARMRSLAVQASNAGLSDANRQAIDQAYQQLGQESDRIAATATYNGTRLLNGSHPGAPQVDPTSGPERRIFTSLPAANAAHLGLGGTGVSTPAAAGQALGRLDDALAGIAAARGSLGAG